jgi:deoxyadenosine/deoxycytidine kinase
MYIVEGNIGAGKSTFLRLLKQSFPHIPVAFEPLVRWDNQESGQSLLAHFYEDPNRWTYTMEMYTLVCRVREYRCLQQHDPLTVVERSIFSGHYVFARNGYLRGAMNPIEWKLYEDWYSFLMSQTCQQPLGFIYLRTDPQISFDRVNKRNRSSEGGIELEYLKQIHDRHEEFLFHKNGVAGNLQSVPVLALDGNVDFEHDVAAWKRHVDALATFFATTSSLAQSANYTQREF